MSIGIAIFASVVLLLVVYHKTFRKVFFWVAGIAAVGGMLFWGGLYLYSIYEVKVEARKQAEQWAAIVAVPAPPPVEDSERKTCGLMVKLHPDWYLVDGFGHCTLKPYKKISAPKIMATISADRFNCHILWSMDSNERDRRELLTFKGGEQVEYIGGTQPMFVIVKYHGIKGYVDYNLDINTRPCVQINPGQVKP
jgi:hypothetical protein